VRPGYPGHPFPHPYLYICVYFPARHLGWAVIAAIVGSQPPQPQDEGYGIEGEGRRTISCFCLVCLIRDRRAHPAQNSRLVLYLFVFIIQQNQLRFRYPTP